MKKTFCDRCDCDIDEDVLEIHKGICDQKITYGHVNIRISVGYIGGEMSDLCKDCIYDLIAKRNQCNPTPSGKD